MKIPLMALCTGLLFLLTLPVPAATADKPMEPGSVAWARHDDRGNLEIPFYFFWSASCPHCTRARPVIEALGRQLPWVRVYSLPLSQPENRVLYQQLAAATGHEAASVPGFIFCGIMLTGFDDSSSPAQLEALLGSCYQQLLQSPASAVSLPANDTVNIPGLGLVNAGSFSLPALTLVLALLDSFNPCAFFVLLFLLSLLIHASGRKRMLVIGGVYVGISGVVYFLFMAAWLNLFMAIGDARGVTTGAGLVAILMALINIKDFFWFQKGVTLGIPESGKTRLYQRMRDLLGADNLPAMLFGTVVLAVIANSYELLCTAGLPMIYTRALTLHQLPPGSYYLYLALYNLIYVVPLILIVMAFVMTLGSRKLQEHEGRALKLMSGLMMLGLGLLLVFAPGVLNSLLAAVGLLFTALLLTVLSSRFIARGSRD